MVLFWRYYWFWRNPPRVVPAGEHVVSPADGTVVYVKRAEPREPIIVCKQGRAASINDIVRIGSQVDLIFPDLPGLKVLVQVGDRVTAGETILIT